MSKSTEVYPRLHDIARWAMVVCEILEVNIKTLEYVLDCHDHFMKELSDLEPKSTANPAIHGTHQYLRFYAHVIYSMNCRCASYRDRMKNEIQLVFNVVAQSEARASMAIAMATKADSETMKATSLVALVFLPPHVHIGGVQHDFLPIWCGPAVVGGFGQVLALLGRGGACHDGVYCDMVYALLSQCRCGFRCQG